MCWVKELDYFSRVQLLNMHPLKPLFPETTFNPCTISSVLIYEGGKRKLHAYEVRAQKSVWDSIYISETQGNKDTSATVSICTRKNVSFPTYKKMIQQMHSKREDVLQSYKNTHAMFYCL